MPRRFKRFMDCNFLSHHIGATAMRLVADDGLELSVVTVAL